MAYYKFWLLAIINSYYTPISHNFKTPYLILCRLPLCSQDRSDLSWHWDIHSGSYGSCMLGGGGSIDRTDSDLVDCGGQSIALGFSCFSSQCWAIFVVCQRTLSCCWATAIKECHAMRGCTWSTTMFGCLVCQVASTWMPGPKFTSRRFHCN